MRVLIIDDEPILAQTLQRLLSHAATVDTTSSGLEGFRLCQTHPYDAIICDLSLNDLPGLALLARLQASNPDLGARVILMTGGAASPEELSALSGLGKRVLDKPFSPEQLFAALRLVTLEAWPS